MAADDKRIATGQGGYNSGVYVDSKNPDIVYTFHVTAYKSIDGGNSFTAFKGGPPGGDDPQVMWIDPTDGKRMLMGYDQGAIVSFDGGDTWSSWYNQSTEQVYHIATDNSFPYWIYATQQDAGAIATNSRGNLGTITPIDWKPVPGWEWGTILPDPRNPNVVYSSGLSISKITYPGGEWINVGPEQDPSLKLRVTLNLPILFATWHGRRELLAGYQYVMATADGGATWSKLSPDLTTPHPGVPVLTAKRVPVRDSTAPPRRLAIWSIAASAVTPGVIWIGTTNGLVQVSRDHGRSWTDVSAGTYGRGIWILDACAVLRQLDNGLATRLFKPSDAVRVRRNVNYNTPFPKEVPQAPNPPEGAIIYYSLAIKPSADIAIDVLDARGHVVRHLTSAAPAAVREAERAPMERFWLAQPSALPANIGLNRATWDLRYDPPPAFAHSFVFNGNPGSTPPAPEGPLAMPGVYRVRLTVDGNPYTQTITVRPDPRSYVSPAARAVQHSLLMRLYSGLQAT